MPQTQFWARVRARAECPLRRGAWYRVVDLTPVEAYLDVNHRLLHIPRAFVQVLPLRPPLVYGVCPSCCSRTPIGGKVRTLRCARCHGVFAVGWSDSPWRAFEVLAGRPTAGMLARARTTALRALATAFGLSG